MERSQHPLYKDHTKTIVWYILKYAVIAGNSDVTSITARTRYQDIDKEISYYMDLTPNWRWIQTDPVSFTDDYYQSLGANEELLIFTDGSGPEWSWRIWLAYATRSTILSAIS